MCVLGVGVRVGLVMCGCVHECVHVCMRARLSVCVCVCVCVCVMHTCKVVLVPKNRLAEVLKRKPRGEVERRAPAPLHDTGVARR